MAVRAMRASVAAADPPCGVDKRAAKQARNCQLGREERQGQSGIELRAGMHHCGVEAGEAADDEAGRAQDDRDRTQRFIDVAAAAADILLADMVRLAIEKADRGTATARPKATRPATPSEDRPAV